MGRALKRASNRRKFNKLPTIVQKAIEQAKEETNKRYPPRRNVRKHIRKEKNRLRDARQDRAKFLNDLLVEVRKNLKQRRQNKIQKLNDSKN